MSRGGLAARKVTKRPPVPNATQQQALLESGYTCSVPWCQRKDGLQLHHINGNPDDNRPGNLLPLCSTHHHLSHAPGTKLDRQACQQLKDTITRLSASKLVDWAVLERTWRKLRTGKTGRARREELFEFLVENLLASVPGLFIVEKRVLRSTGEVDIVLRNDSADAFVGKLPPYIVAGCQVCRRRPAGGKEVADLLGRMAMNRWKAAFLFCLSGFTPDAVAAAGNVSGKELLIALVGPDGITAMIQSGNRADTIRQAVEGSLAGG